MPTREHGRASTKTVESGKSAFPGAFSKFRCVNARLQNTVSTYGPSPTTNDPSLMQIRYPQQLVAQIRHQLHTSVGPSLSRKLWSAIGGRSARAPSATGVQGGSVHRLSRSAKPFSIRWRNSIAGLAETLSFADVHDRSAWRKRRSDVRRVRQLAPTG